MDEQLENIRRRLGKKATFEGAVQNLRDLISQVQACSIGERQDILGLVNRCFTLLKTRYTAPAFWKAGKELFLQAQVLASDGEEAGRLEEFLEACSSALDEEVEQRGQPASQQQRNMPYLFEGQLGPEPPPRPPSLMDALAAAAGQQVGPDELLAQLSGLQEIQENAELEALMQSMQETGPNPAGPPPASRSAVKALEKVELTQERLAELGGEGTQCSVCRNELAVGEEVQVMPCSAHHVFHPPCLAPWLQLHNSCPVCRHELPTDDLHYENRKQRAAQEAEDAAGRANALSHNEFMYI